MKLLHQVFSRFRRVLGQSKSEPKATSLAAAYYFDQGIALESQGRMVDALQSYEAAIQLQPTLARAYFNQANILLDQGNASKALVAYEKALIHKPDSASTHFNIGTAWSQLGQPEKAVEAYLTATHLNPEFADAESALCNVLGEMERMQESAFHYKRAIEINPACINPFFLQGLQHQDQKQLPLAQSCYRKALQIQPDHWEAINNLGVVYFELGQLNEAEKVLRQGLKLNSGNAEIYKNLGICLMALKQFANAAECFHSEIAIAPDKAFAHIRLGNAHSELNAFEAALTCYTRAFELEPTNIEALFNRGSALLKLKQFELSSACFLQVLVLEPTSAEAYNNLGFIKRHLLQTEDAIAQYQKAIALKPDFAEALSNLGYALQTLGKTDEATKCYLRSLEINPDLALTHCSYGSLFHILGKTEQAETHFRRAIELQSNLHDAYNNLGVILNSTRRFDEAIQCFKHALEIEPGFASAYLNWATVLKDRGQLKEALEYLEHAIKLEPDLIEAHTNLLFTHNFLADQPAALMLSIAREFGHKTRRKALPFTRWWGKRSSNRTLRVGFVSGDLRVHPVGYFIEGVLSSLSKEAADQLELYAYPTTICDDALSHRIKANCAIWCPASGLSDEALAKRIHSDRIDILIDLAGHTAHNRLPVFAWRAAPVQVSWLGYFATTGVAEIDYLIADAWTLPPSEEVYFTEKIWRLPETRLCFTAPDVQVAVSPLPAIENDYITFGCFNNLAKMNDTVVSLWARILHALPTSRLFLKSIQLAEASLRQEIAERFVAHGIEADRLILEAYGPRADYLAAYQRVDIALDPFPYPGGTTTVEALWMGVPVLTLRGERFLSRQGVGLMMNAGLPDWVATDPDDYLGKALSHANDLQALANLRMRLRQQVLTSPIFDAPRFAQHFVAALRAMWTQWCAHSSDEDIQPQKVADGTV